MRDTYAIAGREPCFINTADAKAGGSKPAMWCGCSTTRGQILAGAKVTDAIRPGVIRVSEGGWYDPVTPANQVVWIDMGTSMF